MNGPLTLKLKRLNSSAILPTRGSTEAACFDFHAIDDDYVAPNGPTVLRTGWAVEIPPGYAMLINSRSGHGFKLGVRLANSQGIIDSDYRGEVCVKLTADEHYGLRIKRGDRIAQFMVLPVPSLELVEVDGLSETERGEGGFGSSDKVRP